jgi:hypothetical protein
MNTPNIETIIKSNEEMTFPISLLSIDELAKQLSEMELTTNVTCIKYTNLGAVHMTFQMNSELAKEKFIEQSRLIEAKKQELDEQMGSSEAFEQLKKSMDDFTDELMKAFQKKRSNQSVIFPNALVLNYKVIALGGLEKKIGEVFDTDKIIERLESNVGENIKDVLIKREHIESITIKGTDITMNSKDMNLLLLLSDELKRPLNHNEVSTIQ